MAHRAPSSRRRPSGIALASTAVLVTASAALLAYIFLRSPSSDIPAGAPPAATSSAPSMPPSPSPSRSKAAVMHRYTVRPGDTLGSIAQRFYGSAMQWMIIYQANKRAIDMQGGVIVLGQRLIIPVVPR